MIGSPLATAIIPAYKGNYTAGRAGHAIRKITIHHMAARWTAARCGESFQVVGRKGSSHYGIGYDGEIAQYVSESDTAWTDGDWTSNLESVTIENSDKQTGAPWDVTSETLDALIRLCSDIAIRNGLGLLVKGQNLTWHSMYQATACPGQGLLEKMDYICEQANKIITGGMIDFQRVICSYKTLSGGRWLPPVTGSDKDDKINGYAGNFGHIISGIYIDASCGNVYYKAHIKGGGWLPEVKNNENFAGIAGKPIDAIMARSDVTQLHYCVHTLGGGWLPYVTGYTESDRVNGYAGIFGKEIDAVIIYADDILNRIDETPEATSAEEKPEAETAQETTPKVETTQETEPETTPDVEKQEKPEEANKAENNEPAEEKTAEAEARPSGLLSIIFDFLKKILIFLRGMKQ